MKKDFWVHYEGEADYHQLRHSIDKSPIPHFHFLMVEEREHEKPLDLTISCHMAATQHFSDPPSTRAIARIPSIKLCF
jgi:hypothetical protein